MNAPLERIYKEHHDTRRGDFFLVNGEERGSFLARAVGKGRRVLDIGCRDGALTAYYASGNEVTGMDIDSSALLRAAKTLGIRTVHADLNGSWPVVGPYDSVVACEIIEHLYYPAEVARKAYSLLVPGGTLLGSIPHAFSLQSRFRLLLASKQGTALQDPTHINHFTVREFRSILASAGFIDITITTIVAEKFQLLARLFPYTFAHSLLFSARKPEV